MAEVEFVANRALLRGEVTSSCALCGALIAFTDKKQLYILTKPLRGNILVGTSFSARLPTSCSDTLKRGDENQPLCRILEMFKKARYFEV